MADLIPKSNQPIPSDLQVQQQSQTDKNFFNFKATGLKVDKNYAIKFQWVYKDGKLSPWSNGYPLLTNTESVPAAPSATVASTGSGVIPVTLNAFPQNAKRVDVFVIGGVYGVGKVAYSFFAAGTHNIPVAAGSYQVVLLTVTPTSINGDPTSSFSITVTDPTANLQVDPSATPSVPTVSQTLGAIQLSWNGKTSSGADQPNGFKAAKVYVGTASNFTPIDTGNSGANQVDVLNFGNGQNTLNISIGTVVNGVAMDYGIDYFVKIKTTNGNVAQDSSPVLAAGSPVRIGQVRDGDIIEILADKIRTGTISSQIITVGNSAGKHIKLSGTGDPLTVYGTGGTNDSLLSFGTNNQGQSVLTIKGSGSFSGDISAATGTLTNSLNIGSFNPGTWGGRGYPFSVNSSGNVEASSGKIGGWTIDITKLQSTASNGGQIALFPITGNGGKIALIKDGVEKITIDAVEGIVGPDVTIAGNTGPAFKIGPTGNAQFRGTIYAENGTFSGSVTGAVITGGTFQTSSNTSARRIVIAESSPDTISFYSGDSTYPVTGFVKMDTSINGLPALTIQPPVGAGWTGNPKISTWGVSSGGFLNLEAFSITSTATNGLIKLDGGILTIKGGVSTTFEGGFVYFSSTLGARNTVGSSAAQEIFRNISAGTSNPSGGLTGDVYIQY